MPRLMIAWTMRVVGAPGVVGGVGAVEAARLAPASGSHQVPGEVDLHDVGAQGVELVQGPRGVVEQLRVVLHDQDLPREASAAEAVTAAASSMTMTGSRRFMAKRRAADRVDVALGFLEHGTRFRSCGAARDERLADSSGRAGLCASYAVLGPWYRADQLAEREPDLSIGTSIFLIAAGAILRYAVTAEISGVELQTVGLILMVVGIIGLVISLAVIFLQDKTASAAARTTRRVATSTGATGYHSPADTGAR